jgi:hypothetical protein
MAFSAAAYNGAGLAGSHSLKRGKSFSFGRMSALLGGGAFAGLFAFAAFASLHSMAVPQASFQIVRRHARRRLPARRRVIFTSASFRA